MTGIYTSPSLAIYPQTGFSVTEVIDLREEIASDWQEAFKENGKAQCIALKG